MDVGETNALLDSYLAPDGSRAFASVQGVSHAITFVKRSGVRWSLMYSHLLWVYYNPACGLRIQFSTHCIGIEGHRLARIAESITERSQSLLQEIDERYVESGDTPVVTAIRAIANNGHGEPFALPDGLSVQPERD